MIEEKFCGREDLSNNATRDQINSAVKNPENKRVTVLSVDPNGKKKDLFGRVVVAKMKCDNGDLVEREVEVLKSGEREVTLASGTKYIVDEKGTWRKKEKNWR